MIISNPSVPPANNVTTLTAVNLKQVAAQLGLGATPSGWFSVLDALELAHGVSLCGNANTSGQLLFNAVQVGAATWYYKETGYAARLYTDTAGSVYIDTAPSGSAGTTITFTNRMKVALDGTLTGGKAATSLYTRITPNHQVLSATNPSMISLSNGNNTIAAPAGAKAVEVSWVANAIAAGAAAPRFASISARLSATGLTVRNVGEAETQEYTGTSSGVILQAAQGTCVVPVFSGYIYLYTVLDTGGQSTASAGFCGIFD